MTERQRLIDKAVRIVISRSAAFYGTRLATEARIILDKAPGSLPTEFCSDVRHWFRMESDPFKRHGWS